MKCAGGDKIRIWQRIVMYIREWKVLQAIRTDRISVRFNGEIILWIHEAGPQGL
jgi:hypothetical protein